MTLPISHPTTDCVPEPIAKSNQRRQTLTRFLRLFQRSDSGQALMEFALVSPLFILCLIGVTDLSFFLIQAMAVQECVAEGANYGSAPGNQNDNAGMVAWASQAAYGANLVAPPTSQTFYTCSPGGSQVSSSTVCSGGAGPMEYVKVTATSSTLPLMKTKLFSMFTVSATATYRVAWHQ